VDAVAGLSVLQHQDGHALLHDLGCGTRLVILNNYPQVRLRGRRLLGPTPASKQSTSPVYRFYNTHTPGRTSTRSPRSRRTTSSRLSRLHLRRPGCTNARRPTNDLGGPGHRRFFIAIGIYKQCSRRVRHFYTTRPILLKLRNSRSDHCSPLVAVYPS
jgi:hypothetical protein